MDAIREQEPKPTQLLALLSSQLSYGKIQDILSELLESGTVEFGSDRRLRMVLRERPVPDKAESVPSGKDAATLYEVWRSSQFQAAEYPWVYSSEREACAFAEWYAAEKKQQWEDNVRISAVNRIAELERETAALAAERDQSQSETEFWQRELDNFRRNAAHRAEQIAAEKVAEAERSNSLLRERLSAIEKIARENERDGYGFCNNQRCGQLAPNHDENCWLAILLLNKENQ